MEPAIPYLSTREATRVLEHWLDRITRKRYDATVNPMGLRLDDRRVIFPVGLRKPGNAPWVEAFLVTLNPGGTVHVSTLDPDLMGWSWHSETPQAKAGGMDPLPISDV